MVAVMWNSRGIRILFLRNLGHIGDKFAKQRQFYSSSYLCSLYTANKAAEVAFTFVRKLQTQPLEYLPTAVLQQSASEEVDPNVTVYYHPACHPITVKLSDTVGVSIINSNSPRQVVDAGINEKLKESLHNDQLPVSEAKPLEIQSVDDLLNKEIKPGVELSLLPSLCMQLAKMRLTGLVVVTSMAGYALAPGAFSAVAFLTCCIGTGLTSASANAVNQFLEVPFDSQMSRTRTRPLVKGLISPLQAVGFAATAGLTGAVVLWCGANQLTAMLGIFNILLYTGAYTPLKRLSISNTWIGSIVGAIPPMMGWAASAGTLHIGAWLLGAIMYAWQFPHFCALSWNLRQDYSRAGYRMMSVVKPALCQSTALRYSVTLSGLCLLVPYFDVTTWTFAVDSLPLNTYLVYLASRFYHYGDSNSSRKLFHFSLIHLPAVLILMLISKKHFGQAADNVDCTLA